MKTFSFIVWQIKIPFYEIPVLGHSPFSIYKSTIRCYAEIILRLKVSSDLEEYKNSIITMWSISQKRFRRLCVRVRYFTKRDKCGILNIG